MSLFDYIYKKTSVDFIGSMPLSRKTIFITNTIGGIGIIALMQLINLICVAFLSKVLSNVIIFGSMAWDIFNFFTIAYIFVFIVSNLAMSFSGNKFSQLVAICLILFLIPFITLSGNLLGDNYSYINIENSINQSTSELVNMDYINIDMDEPYYFTAPSYIFDMIATDCDYEYSSRIVVKMCVLSIIYFFIGLFLFNRKKLEMAGESYEKVSIHLVIKLLTFTPFMFVYCSLNSSDRINVILFFIAILGVYYFIFDLITNKKIKLKISVPAFLGSVLIVFAIYEGIIPKFGKNNIKKIDLNDVESVIIESINDTYRRKNDFGMLVENKELIRLILENKSSERYEVLDYTSKNFVQSEATSYIVPIEVLEEPTEKSDYRGSNAGLVINLKNGKTYNYRKYINANVYENILKKYGNQKAYINVSNMVPLLEGMHLNKNEKEEIIKILEREIKDLTYKELYDIYNSENTEYTLRMYKYVNHTLIESNVSFKEFKELYQYIAKKCNEFTLQLLSQVYNFHLYGWNDIEKIIKQEMPEFFSGDKIVDRGYEKIIDEFRYNVFDYTQKEVIEFIRSDSKNSIDINKEYMVIESYHPTFYYTNNIEQLNKLIVDSCKEFIKNNYEYYLEY